MTESLLSPSGIKLYGRILNDIDLIKYFNVKKKAKELAKVGTTEASAAAAFAKIMDETNKLNQYEYKAGMLTVLVAATEARLAAGSTAATVTAAAVAAADALPDDPDGENNPYANGPGANDFLKEQLSKPNAKLARIYSFAYEGQLYHLPRPAVFLVHGPGKSLTRGGTDRTDVDTAGVAARDWEFSDPDKAVDDLRRWDYDKGDLSMRFDIESGTFEQILLDVVIRGGTLSSGADLRSSGADARISGADARISGADLRRR